MLIEGDNYMIVNRNDLCGVISALSLDELLGKIPKGSEMAPFLPGAALTKTKML
jgi:hypothetical protein